MTLTPPKFKSVLKDRLFYDLWEYAISFYLPEASCLRKLDHNAIDIAIGRRREWRKNIKHLITDETITSLHTVCEALLSTTYEFKIVISSNNVWVYSNEIRLITELDQLSDLKFKEYTQAVLARPKNTIWLKNSEYTDRSYFKILKLTSAEKERLCNFFVNQHGHVRMSPALSKWFDSSFNRLQDYFFIDHTGDSWLLMLALIRPGLIRKTMQIVTK